MICKPCAFMADQGLSGEWHTNGQHAGQCNEECPGGTWCDCQHRPVRILFVPHVGSAPTTEQLAAGSDITGHVTVIEAP
ncbi:hypothetical protein C1I98_13475 [Spongiactinospora gelatinilytica]|uniref:Uncharacterized protein n=1 Tax=Spongiactinospora gelatinilytica TaxID=2666298 RepID=A0A2W2H679_9ACTN|nr:hypothetical protein [Spongiactinospora gelatinilytica]PZG47475.1 hypothetical protein C1I98_13475 [Spongiactinospora gelatinilytica]